MNYTKPFPKSEYDRRIAQTKQSMVAKGFDLIICQDPANMNWLTGFDGWSFYTPQAVLLHLEEGAPIWFGRPQDAKAAHITTDIPSENITTFSETLIHHPTEHPYDDLAELIIGRGWAKHRIGVELDAHYYTARAHAHLANGLPNARINDTEQLVNWERLVKSDAELAYMREAGQTVSAVMNRAIEKVAPGVREYEIIAEVYHAQVMGVEGRYGNYSSLCPLIQVGEGTSTPHLTWSEHPLPNDSLVMMELGGARHHYQAPLTRTLYLGRPPADVTKLTETIVEGVDAALDVARPGVTCEAVEAVWQKVLNRNGYQKESRVGYSIGVNYPPDWGERTASLRPGDKTVLQSGMCFHFQSGVWLESIGAAVSEPFVVTENGGERLCDVHRELIVID
ncbi:MAG: M24 family metallopeptidase [Proteobacteria bacterium]|nr:M24 family metallopeptidase [Pseudomonadota bacterium]